MTRATPNLDIRHDTLMPVTTKSGRGTARQTIRIPEALWERFGESAASVDNDRSALIRDFIRWYAREPGAKLPKRPDPPLGVAPEQPVITGEENGR